jgi:hypothetical protein
MEGDIGTGTVLQDHSMVKRIWALILDSGFKFSGL